MWGALLASAAANKVVAIGVGATVIIGSAGAVEVTGIGPTVRDIVHESADAQPEDTQELNDSELALVEDEPEDAELAVEEVEDAGDEGNGGEHYTLAAEDGPGNLVWHERDGAFHLRGLLVDEDGIAVRTAGPDGETVDLVVDESVELNVPGGHGKNADEPVLEDYVGYLVRATGECTVEPTETTANIDSESESVASEGESELVEVVPTDASDCTVTEIQILGNAGRPDADDEETASLESDESDQSLLATDGGDEVTDDEGQGGPPEGHGKPDHAGGPKSDEESAD
jgi:hypothetical protein